MDSAREADLRGDDLSKEIMELSRGTTFGWLRSERKQAFFGADGEIVFSAAIQARTNGRERTRLEDHSQLRRAAFTPESQVRPAASASLAQMLGGPRRRLRRRPGSFRLAYHPKRSQPRPGIAHPKVRRARFASFGRLTT